MQSSRPFYQLENNTKNTEKKFLEAMAWVEKNDFAEARKLLLEIIDEDESFPNSYHYLGWIYSNKFNNDVQAEFYFKKGIDIDKNYLPIYYNYVTFLLEKGRTKDTKKLLEILEKKETVSLYDVFYNYGVIYEIEDNLGKAIKYYEMALQKSLGTEALNKVKESISRCRWKRIAKNPLISVFLDQKLRAYAIIFIGFILFMILLNYLN